MSTDPDLAEIVVALQNGTVQLLRRVRQLKAAEGFSDAESTALSRLERLGSATSSEMARLEHISPQAMGTTFAALEARGLIARSPDPDDGRRILLAVTPAGAELVRTRHGARIGQLAAALADGFTPADLEALRRAGPLLERLAERL